MLNDLSKGYIKEMKGPFIQILKTAKKGFQKEHIFDDRLKFDHITGFLNVFSQILYEFRGPIDMEMSYEEPKVPTKDLVDIKFAVIEFLYEFLLEDINRVKETQRRSN